jgi:hypothetical protein
LQPFQQVALVHHWPSFAHWCTSHCIHRIWCNQWRHQCSCGCIGVLTWKTCLALVWGIAMLLLFEQNIFMFSFFHHFFSPHHIPQP